MTPRPPPSGPEPGAFPGSRRRRRGGRVGRPYSVLCVRARARARAHRSPGASAARAYLSRSPPIYIILYTRCTVIRFVEIIIIYKCKRHDPGLCAGRAGGTRTQAVIIRRWPVCMVACVYICIYHDVICIYYDIL